MASGSFPDAFILVIREGLPSLGGRGLNMKQELVNNRQVNTVESIKSRICEEMYLLNLS